MTAGKLSSHDCASLGNRITQRIQSWMSKSLSYARGVQTINSVLFSMSNYWCSVFILPKKVVHLVKQKCCTFLWSGFDRLKGLAKISWGTVCLPKAEGGALMLSSSVTRNN